MLTVYGDTMYDAPTLTAIDPVNCGCTECLTGEYVPINKATRANILALIKNELRDNTNYGFTVTIEPTEFTLHSRDGGGPWTFDYYEDDIDFDALDDIIKRLVLPH